MDDLPINERPDTSFPTTYRVASSVQLTLRVVFAVVPIVAGLDKFTNILADWQAYLNPLVLRIVPMGSHAFMHLVGVIEVLAGLIVAAKPRFGGYLVMAWLIAIAVQLLAWGQFLDVAVRDLALAIGGALSLARLTPSWASRQP
jgi:uncharacterized membrane protein YphA (DoxX/SURF4 family)